MAIADRIQPISDASPDSGGAACAIPNTGAGPLPIDTYRGRWWVLHTKARNEKALAADLSKLHVNCFLPLIRYKRTYAGRIRPVEIPLFPGYLFLCGSEEDRHTALRTNRIAKVLTVADQEQLRIDLRQICRIVRSDVPVDLYPRLRKGTCCRVIAGTLAGLEGVVLRRRGPWKVYVGVEFLGQSAELEIDPSFLEVLD